MTRRLLVWIGAVVMVVGLSAAVAAQQVPVPTFQAATARTWKQMHDKILVMARDTGFPDDKLGFRPHPDSRTVLEELRHVTIGLEMSTANLKGDPFDYYAREKADAGKPNTRASVVAEMEAAIAESYKMLENGGNPLHIFWIEHQAEHYGKLVSDYRMVGIVPPISRK